MNHVGRIWKLAALAAAMLALGGIATATASAAPKALHLFLPHYWTDLEPGGFYELEENEFIAESSSGNVTCPYTQFEYGGFVGKDLTNKEKTDKIEVNHARGVFEGELGCSSTLPIGGVALVYTGGSSPLGTLLVSTNGKAELKATTQIYFEFLSRENERFCTYSFKKLKGVFPIGSNVEPKFSKQKLTLKESNIPNCPKKMSLTTQFSSAYAPNPAAENERANYGIEGLVS